MSYTITQQQFTAALKEVVAERGPDYVYPDERRGPDRECMYVWNTDEGKKPGCLIGAALHRCGVPLEELQTHECCSAGEVWYRLTGSRMDYPLLMAQGGQDDGLPWGQALAAYLRNVRG